MDDNAIGARTVIAADLNGDGWLDLASASKDDDTVAWYPNDGTGHFQQKIVISSGEESDGAYSLVSADIDQDGDEDLIVASNGNDHVSIWRNDGLGNFSKTLVFDNADFVLSVTVADFDRDGDMDIASASFFDGYINWYENLDGEGYEWRNHTIYIGASGHYVSHGDVDGDGDVDLVSYIKMPIILVFGFLAYNISWLTRNGPLDVHISTTTKIGVDHAANSVIVFFAKTECDDSVSSECCLQGLVWNGTSCESCPTGTYGVGFGATAQCVECPSDCTIPGMNTLPATCGRITGCVDVENSLASCSCPKDTVKSLDTDVCTACPEGMIRPDLALERGLDTLGNYSAWELQQGNSCKIPEEELPPPDYNYLTNIRPVGLSFFAITWAFALLCGGWTEMYRNNRVVKVSQPPFLRLIILGCLIMASSIIPLSIDDSIASQKGCSIACMSFPWVGTIVLCFSLPCLIIARLINDLFLYDPKLLSIGFTATFAALFSKIWRLSKVLDAAS